MMLHPQIPTGCEILADGLAGRMWPIWTAATTAVLLAVGSQYIIMRLLSNRRIARYTRALEMVAETSAAILGSIGHSTEIWHRLASEARTLTGAKMSSIVVLSDDGKYVRFIACNGVIPTLEGSTLPLGSMPSVQKCVDKRVPVNVPDTEKEFPLINRAMARQYDVRSMLQVPLMVGERIIGVMMLGSERKNCFDATAARVAELWSLFAAVTIANEHLYEQMGSAIETRDRLLRQQDALFAVNAVLALQRAPEEILRRIVELAPQPLGVDLCQVSLVDGRTNELVIEATSPPYDEIVNGFRYPLAGTNPGRAISEKRPVVIEDGPNDPKSQPYLKKVLPCGSIMHIPLFSGNGEAIGVLVLLRKQTGGFTSEQQNLAQLFATRAAAAIENAQLYQQTLRGSQTQTMLLRELTHRVKNNLAGIVALLSIDRPALSLQAQQWLGRVVDRIRTLARTHEMLASGRRGGGLRELIEQTVHALGVVTPAGVSVRIEIPERDILLRADRAVSVAMILHELCYNALVHGLADAGTLVVQAAIEGEKSLEIDVIDDGRGFVPADAAAQPHVEGGTSATAVASSPRTGLGLNLVRDFVARELHGQFSIESTPGTGTRARVEFALLDEEARSGL
ncbi:MAG: GAF domain-containing protein [Tepidisphaeraceae bacterium]|jgi:GAF domain-containing protein